MRHRLVRVSDRTRNIALGLAIGLGVSFTPIMGTHFIQAALIAYILRANIFSAIIGTFVGNPWTFPFFWWAGLSFGDYLYVLFDLGGVDSMPQHFTLPIFWEILKTKPLTLFMPWMLGGYTLCLLSIPLIYPVYFYLIKTAKLAQANARLHRSSTAQNKTGQAKP